MKKPINKFALTLWVVAALLLVGEAWSSVVTWENMNRVFHQADANYLAIIAVWNSVRSAMLSVGLVAALGVIIELIDHIRWIEKSRGSS